MAEVTRYAELMHESQEPRECESADLRLGPMDKLGVLAARGPLACFGGSIEQVLTVGFEASEPRRPPPKTPGRPWRRLYTWVRLKPARVPSINK
jgi:hypothetical protein